MTNDRYEISMVLGFDLENSKAVVGVVKGHPLDAASEDLRTGGCRGHGRIIQRGSIMMTLAKDDGGCPMPRAMFVVSSCVVCSFSACGCDPVRTTLQHVRLQVTKSESGRPVDGALIWLRYDYDRGERFLKRDTEYWKEVSPWHAGVTNKQGEVKVGIQYTGIDRTIGAKPPAWRDWVTGQPYVIRVRGDKPQEEFSLVIRPNTSAKGKFFAVSVLEIERPRYVGPD